MKRIKKLTKFLVILLLSLVFLIVGLTEPVWPSKVKLCQDLENYISKAECINLDSRIAIVKRAFPEGKTSASDVRSALGEYLQEEHSTSYGHTEKYYLSVQPIDYLFRNFDSYRFRYDDNGVLVAFSYED